MVGLDVSPPSGFNSRTPGGVRQIELNEQKAHLEFQFTHPGRGATKWSLGECIDAPEFQFTHPGRGATKNNLYNIWKIIVSIHAPREGCDFADLILLFIDVWFQFTHPGRGATWSTTDRTASPKCFNSRTPGGVRQRQTDKHMIDETVSIHAPREGCDHDRFAIAGRDRRFQFTHPGRGATTYLR